MSYRVTFKGGVNADKSEDRVIDAIYIEVGAAMTTLKAGDARTVLLIVPNDRVIAIEKVN